VITYIFNSPPSYIKRQRPITIKKDEFKDIKFNREGHHLGFTGALLRFKYKDTAVDCTDNKKGLKVKRDPDQLKTFDRFYQLRYSVDNCFCIVKMIHFTYRPLFTMWITFTHILIMIVTTSIYGLAPYGFDYQTETELVSKQRHRKCITVFLTFKHV